MLWTAPSRHKMRCIFFFGMDQFREKDSANGVTEGPKDWFTGFY